MPRTAPAGYTILPDRKAWQHVASNGTAAPATRDLARVALAWLLKGRTESQLDWMFGSATGQALIFRGMERVFRSGHADGVEGSLQYVVHDRPRVVRVAGGRLLARPGVEPRPDASLRMRGARFARIADGCQQTASSAAMVGQLQIEGDLRLVARLGAALGQPPI